MITIIEIGIEVKTILQKTISPTEFYCFVRSGIPIHLFNVAVQTCTKVYTYKFCKIIGLQLQ